MENKGLLVDNRGESLVSAFGVRLDQVCHEG